MEQSRQDDLPIRGQRHCRYHYYRWIADDVDRNGLPDYYMAIYRDAIERGLSREDAAREVVGATPRPIFHGQVRHERTIRSKSVDVHMERSAGRAEENPDEHSLQKKGRSDCDDFGCESRARGNEQRQLWE